MARAATPPDPEDPHVTLADLVAALSLVADLGFGQPMEHVLHTCLMARRLGEVVGADAEVLTETYWVSMLGMVGCIADSYELRQLFGDDIALRAGIYDMGPSSVAQMRYFLGRAGSDATTLRRLRIKSGLVASAMRAVEVSLIGHCEVTSALAQGLGLPSNVGLGLGHVFARWDGKGVPKGVGKDDIRLAARLQSLCDGAEVHHARAASTPRSGSPATTLAGCSIPTWSTPSRDRRR